MGVVPRITDDLSRINTSFSGGSEEQHTGMEVIKNEMFVIGGPGQQSLANIMKGKNPAPTAANPYRFPLPSPVNIYLPRW